MHLCAFAWRCWCCLYLFRFMLTCANAWGCVFLWCVFLVVCVTDCVCVVVYLIVVACLFVNGDVCVYFSFLFYFLFCVCLCIRLCVYAWVHARVMPLCECVYRCIYVYIVRWYTSKPQMSKNMIYIFLDICGFDHYRFSVRRMCKKNL